MSNLALNPSVQLVNGKATTTSLRIAEAFGKQHFNVLRTIKNLECSPEFAALNFEACEYTGDNGKKLPMYTITRDGFAFLASGFTGSAAAQWKEAYIAAFNALEAQSPGQPNFTLEQALERGWIEADPDLLYVTPRELAALVEKRLAEQQALPAPARCPSYHVPASVWAPANRIARTGWLTMAELNRVPPERLPLNALLKVLEKDGHDIAGARLEYQALRHIVETQHNLLGALSKMVEAVPNIGLRVEVAA